MSVRVLDVGNHCSVNGLARSFDIRAQVGLLSILILTPMIYLSGKFTPPEAMPSALLVVMYIQPTFYYLWDSILAMIVIGGIIFVAAMLSFRRQMG